MKKVLAILLALVMAFSLSLPAFADEPETTTSPLSGIIDSMGPISVTPENAPLIVNMIITVSGSKEAAKAAIDSMHDEGYFDDDSYNNLIAAWEAAEEPTTSDATNPTAPEIDVADTAAKVISALRKVGVKDEQIKDVVDKLYEDERISQEVYEEIIKQLDASETTTVASNEGGIGDFIGGIVDKVKDLFGLGGGNEEPPTTNPGGNSNNNNYEGKEPTGDTAILSVAAVAAVAGVALVLTKKKEK